MKNSNKLLIILAAAFFIIPLLGMMVTAKLYYQPKSKDSYIIDQKHNNLPLHIKAKDRTTLLFKEPFQSVNLVNANNCMVEIHLIKDENYGAKTLNSIKDLVDYKVENGVLSIRFKEKLAFNENRNKLPLLIYAPDFKELSVNKSSFINLIGKADSLKINVNDCGNFSLIHSPIKNIKMVNGDTVLNDSYNATEFKSLIVKLEKSKFSLIGINLHHLDIVANNSTIIIGAPKRQNGVSNIDNLNLKTTGNCTVDLNKLNLIIAKGDFSDDTKLDVPTPILKQLLKE